MNEIDRSLLPSERILYRASVAPIFKIRLWLFLFAFLGLIGWAAASYPDVIAWPYAAGAAALAIILFLRAIIPLWTLKIAVVNDGVIVQRGWIAHTNQEMELKNIEEVNVDQSFFGRLFGYGTVQIRGTGVNSVVLKQVSAPYDLRRAIELALKSNNDIGVPVEREPPRIVSV